MVDILPAVLPVINNEVVVPASVRSSKPRVYENYNNYTKKLLDQTCEGLHIRKESNDMFNIIIDRISIALINEAGDILTYAHRTNMTDKDILTAVILIFPDALAMIAIEYGDRAVRKFRSYKKEGDRPVPKHIKAGLVYPVSRFRTKIEKYLVRGKHIGELASVFLAAIEEFVVIKIFEPTCGVTAMHNVITVNNHHMKAGISKNSDLCDLFKRVGLYFCNGQVIEKTSNFKWRSNSYYNRVEGLKTLVYNPPDDEIDDEVEENEVEENEVEENEVDDDEVEVEIENEKEF